jgi:chorismate mutase
MSRNRSALLLVAGSLLVSLFGPAAAANADSVSPLNRLVDTAAQRLATADPGAAFKWINGGDITDPQRVDQVMDAVGSDATAHGIDAQYVATVFTDQINATEAIEFTRFGQWKFDPATAPTAAPDLSESRSAIDGFNKTMVDEIALQWNSLHSPTCAVELQQATEAIGDARQLDPLYRLALSSATRSYCQLI